MNLICVYNERMLKILKKFTLFFFTSLFLLLAFSSNVLAQSSPKENEPAREGDGTDFQPVTYQARVTQILESGNKVSDGQNYSFQKLELEIVDKDRQGQKVEISTDYNLMSQNSNYKPGDKLMITLNRDFQTANDYFVISDVIRTDALLWLTILFVLVIVLVTGWGGLRAIAAMLLSFVVIFKFLLPQIMAGRDPIMVSLLAALLILPATFIVSHGLNAKSLLGLAATFIGLTFGIFLAQFFVELTALSGFASEEAGFIQVEKAGLINVHALLLAGMMIGIFGILDDVAVSQVAVVEQLHDLKPELKAVSIFSKAMKVGQDHISSMINTLVLVYAGSSLSLLLLFYDSQRSFIEIINQELVAEEIVRTLVGSISLILIAPLATFIAALYYSRQVKTSRKPELKLD